MEFAAVNTPGAALLAGFITSIHCAGMCGPLACTLLPSGSLGAKAAGDPHTVATVYHLSRIGSYCSLGAFGGALGEAPLIWLSQSVVRWIPWLLVLFFVALALRWDRFLPKISALGSFSWKVQSWARQRSPVVSAAMLGFGTPLLPCGPLYFIISLSLLSGSPARGIEFMFAFGLGTVPLLWFAQTQFRWLTTKLSPLWLSRTRVALALFTAGIIAWRLRGTLGFGGPNLTSFVCH